MTLSKKGCTNEAARIAIEAIAKRTCVSGIAWGLMWLCDSVPKVPGTGPRLPVRLVFCAVQSTNAVTHWSTT